MRPSRPGATADNVGYWINMPRYLADPRRPTASPIYQVKRFHRRPPLVGVIAVEPAGDAGRGRTRAALAPGRRCCSNRRR